MGEGIFVLTNQGWGGVQRLSGGIPWVRVKADTEWGTYIRQLTPP